jgi:hypothetical protein
VSITPKEKSYFSLQSWGKVPFLKEKGADFRGDCCRLSRRKSAAIYSRNGIFCWGNDKEGWSDYNFLTENDEILLKPTLFA